jgi:hypothetical protein
MPILTHAARLLLTSLAFGPLFYGSLAAAPAAPAEGAAAAARATLRQVAQLPPEAQQAWMRDLERRIARANVLALGTEQGARENARVAAMLREKIVTWQTLLDLLRQLYQREQVAIGRLVRHYRGQVVETFRKESRALVEREEAWYRVWAAWEKGGSLPQQQDRLIAWLETAIRNSTAATLGPLPPDPRFGPDAQEPPMIARKQPPELTPSIPGNVLRPSLPQGPAALPVGPNRQLAQAEIPRLSAIAAPDTPGPTTPGPALPPRRVAEAGPVTTPIVGSQKPAGIGRQPAQLLPTPEPPKADVVATRPTTRNGTGSAKTVDTGRPSRPSVGLPSLPGPDAALAGRPAVLPPPADVRPPSSANQVPSVPGRQPPPPLPRTDQNLLAMRPAEPAQPVVPRATLLPSPDVRPQLPGDQALPVPGRQTLPPVPRTGQDLLAMRPTESVQPVLPKATLLPDFPEPAQPTAPKSAGRQETAEPSVEPPEPEVRVNIEELAARITGTNLALRAIGAELAETREWSTDRLASLVNRLDILVLRQQDLALFCDLTAPEERRALEPMEPPRAAISQVKSRIKALRARTAGSEFSGTEAERRTELDQLDALARRLAGLEVGK